MLLADIILRTDTPDDVDANTVIFLDALLESVDLKIVQIIYLHIVEVKC